MSQNKKEPKTFKRYGADITVMKFDKKEDFIRKNPDGSCTIGNMLVKFKKDAPTEQGSFMKDSKFIDRGDRMPGPKAIVGSSTEAVVVVLADGINDKQLFNIAKREDIIDAQMLFTLSSIEKEREIVHPEADAEAKAGEAPKAEKPKPARSRRRKPAAKTAKVTEAETDTDV